MFGQFLTKYFSQKSGKSLKNKTKISFTDRIFDDEIKNKLYTLWNYYEDINYYLIIEHHYEGASFYLVNHDNGYKLQIWNIPIILSPSKKKILICSCSEVYEPSGIQIVNINTPKAYIEYEKELKWIPSSGHWKDELKIKIVKNEKFKHKWIISEIELLNQKGKWKIIY